MEIIDGIKWDFGPKDQIDYFDTTKSYWITKYRPINDTDGLDFDPNWFREDAINKLSAGKYSSFMIGTKKHRDFWKERFARCVDGFESHGYRLTGDNMFWLNFYRLKQSIEGKKASAGRGMSFPMFLVLQYEYFHYVEMCEILGKDVGLLKARALGFSEMAASLCARPFITTPNYRIMATAYSDRHLKPLLTKIWSQLDWLANNTETAFKRVRMVQDTKTWKRASKKDKHGVELGHMSEIEGVVADSPEKVRGDRTERLFFEEAGSDRVFKKKYLQGEALITVLGGDRIGTRIAWGTGGDEGVALEGIKDLVLNPAAYNVLPCKHNHTQDKSYIYTAMFIPAYRMVKSLVDSRGWCNNDKAREWYDQERFKKVDDPKGLLIYKAEYCYTIDEALIQQGDNIFPREQLAEQQIAITIYKTVKEPGRGYLTWKYDEDGRKDSVKWTADPKGDIYITEHPQFSEEGTSYKNLYVGGVDSIDIGSADSSAAKGSYAANQLSDFCVVIKRRVFGMRDPGYVAMYKKRPKDPREAYEITAKLLTYYECKAVLETTRTAILTHFRDNGYKHLLMKRPRATMPDVTKGNSNMYGTPATTKVIKHYIELIYEFVLDYCHTIELPEMVSQLLNYSDERKKFFDIIAAMGMAELGDEEYSYKKPEAREVEGKVHRDIGWFTDSNGHKHYGTIPITEEERYATNRPRKEDKWLYSDDL